MLLEIYQTLRNPSLHSAVSPWNLSGQFPTLWSEGGEVNLQGRDRG